MRGDLVVNQVLAKCDALRDALHWPPQKLSPRGWIRNFDSADQETAALLLDRFTYYEDHLTERLLRASYYSLTDGLPKGPAAPDRAALLAALPTAFFTPVEGERPNRADSGNLMCRKARQILRIPEERIVDPSEALNRAATGNAIVFLDDFIGSGDQFVKTWMKPRSKTSPQSFHEAYQTRPFVAAYVSLVAMPKGVQHIASNAPGVAVCTAHVVEPTSTLEGLKPIAGSAAADLSTNAIALLRKYAPRLTPHEDYMTKNEYLIFGYKKRGLLFAFSHCVPDATLPIFWSPGTNGWQPLVERT